MLLIMICLAGIAFILFWNWAQLRDIAEYLPPEPSATEVSISAGHAKVFNNFAVRHFRFTAKNVADAAEAARLFDSQLTTAGWEKDTTSSNGRVSSSCWHHREKLSGNLQLIFTVVLLGGTGEYAGSMVTELYWPRVPTSESTP
jgi:hypothetical protein